MRNGKVNQEERGKSAKNIRHGDILWQYYVIVAEKATGRHRRAMYRFAVVSGIIQRSW